MQGRTLVGGRTSNRSSGKFRFPLPCSGSKSYSYPFSVTVSLAGEDDEADGPGSGAGAEEGGVGLASIVVWRGSWLCSWGSEFVCGLGAGVCAGVPPLRMDFSAQMGSPGGHVFDQTMGSSVLCPKAKASGANRPATASTTAVRIDAGSSTHNRSVWVGKS